MKKNLQLCIFSALLLILSFPAPNLRFLAWVALVPFFYAIYGQPPKRVFLLSYLTGLLFFLGTLYWIAYVTTLGFIVLALYLALYFGIFGLIASRGLQSTGFGRLLFIPAAWATLELIRSNLFGGFGWATLGYTQYRNLALIQIADITGAYGVSFLIVMVNVLLYDLVRYRPFFMAADTAGFEKAGPDPIFPKVTVVVLCLAATLAYGFYRLAQKPEAKALRVSVIQGNIPQEEKWEREYLMRILQKHIALTQLASSDKPELLVWPETSFPGYIETEHEFREEFLQLIRDIEIPLLVGTATHGEFGDANATKGDELTFNSAILFSAKGKPLAQYDKLHLVPFGEYIPAERRFPFLRRILQSGNFSAGKEYTLFSLPQARPVRDKVSNGVKFGVLICFEDTFPGLVREFVKKGADFMINITNDAWFMRSSAPYQHAQASVFRAVENRLSVVRAANTGLSCFIDPKGRIYSRIKDEEGRDIFVAGYKTKEVNTSKLPTFYTTHGDVFAIFCFLYTIVFLGRLFKEHK